MELPKLIERAHLYERVWTVPMTRSCREFGLSDNGLRKICKALCVPTPSIGHWIKLEAGKAAERRPLPPAGAQESYVLETPEYPTLPEDKRSPVTADLADRIAAEQEYASRIVMPPAGRWHSALIPFRDCVLERLKNGSRQKNLRSEPSEENTALAARALDGRLYMEIVCQRGELSFSQA